MTYNYILMPKKLIIANWKSNPDSPGRAIALAKKIDIAAKRLKMAEVIIAPPMPFLMAVGSNIKYAKLGAQDVFWEDLGPYTGETSWRELKKLKVSYVIVGHSERRRLLKETDEVINKKVLACLKNGLKVVLCVGEAKSIRARGMSAVKKFIASQLKKDLRGLKFSVLSHKLLVIAYEPIWAIGSGKPDKPSDSVEVVKFIKKLLASRYSLVARVLYGGSVNAKNARGFLSQKEIDGALVGGASLKPAEFEKIISTA